MEVVSFCKNGKSSEITPESLFKYKSFSMHSVTYFDGYITLTRPDKLNDPWDSQLTPDWTKVQNINQLRNFWGINAGNPEHEKKLNQQLCLLGTSPEILDQEVLDNLNAVIRVCSFGPKWNNTLLWAHYSNMFEGFCIQFNTDKLIQFLTCLNTEKNIKLAEVCYDEDAPSINPIQKPLKISIETMLTTKSKEWKYEEEWRIIVSSEGQEDYQLLKLPKGVIEAVYFGHKASEKDILDASIRLKKFDPEISLYVIRPIHNEFRLDRTLLI